MENPNPSYPQHRKRDKRESFPPYQWWLSSAPSPLPSPPPSGSARWWAAWSSQPPWRETERGRRRPSSAEKTPPTPAGASKMLSKGPFITSTANTRTNPFYKGTQLLVQECYKSSKYGNSGGPFNMSSCFFSFLMCGWAQGLLCSLKTVTNKKKCKKNNFLNGFKIFEKLTLVVLHVLTYGAISKMSNPFST